MLHLPRIPTKPALLVASTLLATGALAVLADATTAPPRVWEALEQQQALVAANPSDPGSLNDLANLQVLTGQLEAAEATYLQALRLAPESPSIRYNLALLLQEDGRLEAAMRELRRVIVDDPGNAWAHYQLGTVLERLGKRGPAIEMYARAFTLDVQLTFPEVNPHVIENTLFMQGLLRAFPTQDRRVMAPMSYRDPARITSLLLAVPETAEGEPAAADGEAGGPAGHLGAGSGGDTPADPGRSPAAGREGAEGDLDMRRPPAYTAPGPPPKPPAEAQPATPPPSGGIRAPEPTTPPAGSEPTPPPRREPPAPRDAEEFEPDPASTGRLDLRLVPAEPEGRAPTRL